MKDIKLLISSLFIFMSFFVGYTLGNQKNLDKINILKNKKYIINLDTSKTKIDIVKPNNIIIKINGKQTNSGTIDLN